jgi:hypothetical protein
MPTSLQKLWVSMNIVKVESQIRDVKIELANGVSFHISSNDGYLHIHASGVDVPLQVFPQSNNLNIEYTELK